MPQKNGLYAEMMEYFQTHNQSYTAEELCMRFYKDIDRLPSMRTTLHNLEKKFHAEGIPFGQIVPRIKETPGRYGIARTKAELLNLGDTFLASMGNKIDKGGNRTADIVSTDPTLTPTILGQLQESLGKLHQSTQTVMAMAQRASIALSDEFHEQLPEGGKKDE